MTNKLITTYTMYLLMAIVITGVATVHASEVTGTLSSDASDNTQSTGNLDGTVTDGSSGTIEGTVTDESSGTIEGTVTSGSGGSSSSGSRSSSGSGGGGSSSDTPTGAVSGATTVIAQTTPSFPNTGSAYEGETDKNIWSAIVDFLRNIFSF